MKQLTFLILGFCLVVHQGSAFQADEVKNLPGLNATLPFKQYSGYLDGGKGRNLFYWFFESEANATADPLVLWLNGGPGCSSLRGVLTENGPFRVKADSKSLELDPFSWNKMANVLYLESPTNVGFSYNSTHLDNADMYNDEAATDTKYHALLSFYKKFPHLKQNKFYITGESYGGFYIPLLTRKVLDNQKQNPINLQGIAIGNPFLDSRIISSTRIEYGYNHGVVSIEDWELLQSTCCHMSANGTKIECDYAVFTVNGTVLEMPNNNTKCADVYATILHLKLATQYDLYYVYDNCNYTDPKRPVDHQCVNPKADYLNRLEVKKALHVAESVQSRTWESCNVKVVFTYQQQYRSMDIVFRDIIEKHKFTNFIIYSGDADLVCDFTSTQKFLLHKMNYKLKEPSQTWKFGDEIAGIAMRFENGLRFFTVHGAGHMVPTQKPEQAIAIVRDLLDIEQIA